MGESKKYRFSRKDFAPLKTKPLHFNMLFDVQENAVKVTLLTTFKHVGSDPIKSIKLNSKSLEILTVEQAMEFNPLEDDSHKFVQHVASMKAFQAAQYEVDTDNHFLLVHLAQPIAEGDEFVLKTVTIAKPTENILEGLYFDYTPEGCPKTIITQCQQHGFQRIVPCIDTMDAKAYYTTTIVADKRYTNIITNGDLAEGFHDRFGAPIYHSAQELLGIEDDTRHGLTYNNHTTNMAPYLFFLGCGTYDTYRRELEYPDGDSFLLEVLSLPRRVERDDAERSLAMLHDSIQWVLVSLGPEGTEHLEEQKRIYELLDEREAIKAKASPLAYKSTDVVERSEISSKEAARLVEIRKELKQLLRAWKKTGYKYTGAVYREIGMDNSNYGGMENVGNTTIVSSCLCPTCTMDDASYEYMERVKAHEYYHNINGSEVTGQSPFEIWLNEAVTCIMERRRYADIFGADYTRLHEVLYMFTPALGPLAQDKSATSMAIEPEGFNQTQELVSVVTYSKAPEFVRMNELLLGKDGFNRALDNYHTKYRYGNATSAEWVACMEEESGLNLQNLAKTWLKRPGHPTVSYTTKYDSDKNTYSVKISQSGFEDLPEENNGPWDIPIDWALVKDGRTLKEGVFFLQKQEDELVIPEVSETPDFLSFARGWSFFGVSKWTNSSDDVLFKQAISDPDPINKYIAYRAIADKEKAKVIEGLLQDDRNVTISPEFVELHGSILFNDELSPSTRALTLNEGKTITNREDLSHHYTEINEARKAILQAVWEKYGNKVLELYNELEAKNVPGPHKDQLNERILKSHLFQIIKYGSGKQVLSTFNPPKIKVNASELALHLLDGSTFVTDKIVGLRGVLEEPAFEQRKAVQARIFENWRQDQDMLAKYIAVVSSLDAPDAGQQVLDLLESPYFKLSLANHSRTLARGLSRIREFSILTDEGLHAIETAFVKIGKVNQMSAYPLLSCFDQIDKFDESTRTKLYATLQRMQDSIDKVSEESLYNQLNIMLKKA